MGDNAIRMVRGTTRKLRLHVTETLEDGTSQDFDLTDCTVHFRAKDKVEDEEPALIVKSSAQASEIEVYAAAEGKAWIKLVPADTQGLEAKQYRYDVWVVTLADERHSVFEDSLTIVAGVTVLP